MESAINIPSISRPSNRRAYLAGGGATAALVAAAVVLFIAIAALVGFNGLPFGADDDGETTVNLTPQAPLAAAASSLTADSVAATPATPDPAALAEIIASLTPTQLAALTPGGTGPGSSDTDDLDGGGPGGPTTPGNPSAPGALGNTVNLLDDTTSGLGLNLGLGGLTEDITGPLDKTVNNTVNGVGGLLGDPKLGDKVNSTANGLTNGLLGQGGLLGPK